MATIHSPQFQESIEYLWSTWKSKITDYTNILVWWEMVKYKIKQLTIETSRAINLSKSTVEKYEKRINEIKDLINISIKMRSITYKKSLKTSMKIKQTQLKSDLE